MALLRLCVWSCLSWFGFYFDSHTCRCINHAPHMPLNKQVSLPLNRIFFTVSTTIALLLLNSCRAEYISENLSIFLSFLCFQHWNDESTCDLCQDLFYHTTNTIKLMNCRREEPGHQQFWYWTSYPGIFQFQVQKGQHSWCHDRWPFLLIFALFSSAHAVNTGNYCGNEVPEGKYIWLGRKVRVPISHTVHPTKYSPVSCFFMFWYRPCFPYLPWLYTQLIFPKKICPH